MLGYRWAWLLGLTLALATLVRPVSYYLVLPLGIWVGLTAGRRHRAWKPATACTLLFVLPFTFLVGGWQWHNRRQTGTAVFSSIEGKNLLFFRGADIVAQRDGISLAEARKQLGKGRYGELHPETEGWSRARLAGKWKQQGLALILDHPTLFARQELHGLAAMFLSAGEHTLMALLAMRVPPTGPLGDLGRLDPKSYLERWLLDRPIAFLAFAVASSFLVILYAGAAGWLWHSLRGSLAGAWDWCAWGILLYLAVISAGPEAYHRFRVPVTPILCLYSATGLMVFWKGLSAAAIEARHPTS